LRAASLPPALRHTGDAIACLFSGKINKTNASTPRNFAKFSSGVW
jgi:hypothetical protein